MAYSHQDAEHTNTIRPGLTILTSLFLPSPSQSLLPPSSAFSCQCPRRSLTCHSCIAFVKIGKWRENSHPRPLQLLLFGGKLGAGSGPCSLVLAESLGGLATSSLVDRSRPHLPASSWLSTCLITIDSIANYLTLVINTGPAKLFLFGCCGTAP